MFYISTIQHKLRVPAHLLNVPIQEAIRKELEGLFLDKVIPNLGLCISVYEIRSIDGGFIAPGDGVATYTVTFNLIVFRPHVGEVIAAKVLKSGPDGLQLSIGFFEDIYVPPFLMKEPSRFEEEPGRNAGRKGVDRWSSTILNNLCGKYRDKGTWVWEYEEEQPLYIDEDAEVKFEVKSVSYPPIPVEQTKDSKPFAPMVVTGRVDNDGLGPVAWW